tara:strand:- start:2144 stop:3505 length:1362 start_codon:yes stop_codon:yes gene_type:complete
MRKIVVFDDDPTGSQTVYGCPLLLEWDFQTLKKAINYSSNLIFILANTRSLSTDLAQERMKEICHSFIELCLKESLSLEDFIFISRGDSTLRGHGVLEPQILMEQLGPFDATFHIPAFLEGGRTTVNGIHFLNGIPVHESDFARDKIFGYSTSKLSDWLINKSNRNITLEDITHISIDQLENASLSQNRFSKLIDFLSELVDNKFVIVDAERPSQLKIFHQALKKIGKNKKFLFRSAASFINTLAALPPNTKSTSQLASLRVKDKDLRYKSGLIIVGSHVKLADEQLDILDRESRCELIELPVRKIVRVIKKPESELAFLKLQNQFVNSIRSILIKDKTPVFYTTRGEVECESVEQRMDLGLKIAEIMSQVVGQIAPELGYIISKGGITTQILLQKGFCLKDVFLEGQILPGLSIVSAYNKKSNIKLPIITFPGNLGDQNTLCDAWKIMEFLE